MVAGAKNRRYTRVAFPKGIRVGWQTGGERFVSAVTTLGLGGLFISTPKPAAVGEVVSQQDRARLDRLLKRLLRVPAPFQPSPS
jgi:hypothetical protein